VFFGEDFAVHLQSNMSRAAYGRLWNGFPALRREAQFRQRVAGLHIVRTAAFVARVTVLGCLVCLGVIIPPLFAEQQKPGQSVAQKSKQPANTKVGWSEAPLLTVPNDEKLVALVSSTLIALNQANVTGNYSVFRELGAPGFQVANSTGQLSETFAKLRRSNFDLSPIVLLQPKLIRRPEINNRGMLRITGFFPTEPERLNFDLIFQLLDGRWRLFGIAANTTPNQHAAPQSSQTRTPTNPAPPPPPATTPTELQEQKGKLQGDVRDRVDSLESASTPEAKP
jgi:hypothetical protein